MIGKTNPYGELPTDRPVTPPDLAFSILKLLGVNPSKEVLTPAGRPIRLINGGNFITELV